jgi:hypothetical protein
MIVVKNSNFTVTYALTDIDCFVSGDYFFPLKSALI